MHTMLKHHILYKRKGGKFLKFQNPPRALEGFDTTFERESTSPPSGNSQNQNYVPDPNLVWNFI
jgi:hypothetical protein